jgi:hypothetical protein
MDGSDFDTLTRAIAQSGTRRRLLALLAALPLGGLLTDLAQDDAAAERPTDRVHRRTQQRNQNQRNNHKNNNKNNTKNTKNDGGSGRLGAPDPCQSSCSTSALCCRGSGGGVWCCGLTNRCCGDGVAQKNCCMPNQTCCNNSQCCDPNQTCCISTQGGSQCCDPQLTCDSEFGCIDTS